jgi:hypothetical protein
MIKRRYHESRRLKKLLQLAIHSRMMTDEWLFEVTLHWNCHSLEQEHKAVLAVQYTLIASEQGLVKGK